MPKVHVRNTASNIPIAPSVGVASPVVSCNRLSLVYSIVYIVTLITEPLVAYSSEPLPWALHESPLNAPGLAFDTFVEKSYAFFSTKYNDVTLSTSSSSSLVWHNAIDNTFVLRNVMVLPANAANECNTYLVRFPASPYYGHGLTRFVCDFLAQNASAQQATHYNCQHGTIAGVSVAESCTWIQPWHDANGTFLVYNAAQIIETTTWSWLKFGLRVATSCLIGCEMWRLYYCHYGPLFQYLKTCGLNADDANVSSRYEVQLGDPTWLILSHPFVTVAMVVDALFSTGYLALATSRVSQLHDLWQFFLGSLYGSRLVRGKDESQIK
ncbi:Aste57867_19749 [Aphanomyces stellatus]|uniref:Aste57867_19749 protein n=1 Tax=Aphanomyces stellatus TaxID=120398 RepID=A0A485LDZ4_9STRA|nr:hypothetical protein As57867_019684 [Aphanomyces stellatus]VFT96447.1 Aste57867_19749 [Aphanomyces stellatus]